MLSPDSSRRCYYLYNSRHGDVNVKRGEPFLVIELVVWYGGPATMVCNAHGDTGLIDLTDVANDGQPAFVPCVSERQQQASRVQAQ